MGSLVQLFTTDLRGPPVTSDGPYAVCEALHTQDDQISSGS